jgi:hypothetical protein
MERQIMMIVVLLYITATLLFSGDPLLNPGPSLSHKTHTESFMPFGFTHSRERP